MARLSRDSKRNRQDTEPAAGPPAAPVDVRVPGAVSAAAPGTAPGATADGVPIVAAPGQEIQHAVLAHLHRLALAAAAPVRATVHDDRIGYVVPIRVDPDGSSRFTAEPVRTAPPEEAVPPAPSACPPPRAVPGAGDGRPPGTVAPPTGVFGPPPRLDAGPGGGQAPARPMVPFVPAEPEEAADRGPAPVRGFDAVAEAVLGDDPRVTPGEGTAPARLAEPTARINEAVRTGRTDAAALLAERTVARASETLGPEHPEVLRLRELTAYIAYLSDDPVRALRISLDLARIHRRAGDAEAAYGSLHGAVTAWRAIRDPERGMELGHDLIGLWAALVAEGGPAADEAERLESARARMGRLAQRARAGQPEKGSPRPHAETGAAMAR
ncbi:tetratricopeptide repeat protein [Streptomyces sp. PRKS01-65]|nr:tetratricopeptide repeat protein [Streptomyces harenosi]NEY34240.1 tetratricopeptide repeat protein [Streptomyces harenosi]